MSIQNFNFIQSDLRALFSKVKAEDLQSLKNSTICITGGTGFVGTWICELVYFLNEQQQFNTKVFVLDRNIEKAKSATPHLTNSPFFNFQHVDIRYLVELPKEVNYIVHAAGLPDSRDHVANPVDVMSTIALGTEAVLRAADRLSNLKMFLNLTSSTIYGGFPTRTENIKEDDKTPVSPNTNFYAEAKKYSEQLTSAFRQQNRFPAVILRPFSFIGPHQALQGPWALNNFISDAINNRSIKILGDGETVRSFLYASDMAFWILKTLLHSEPGKAYNLGSPEAISLKELAKLVTDAFKTQRDILYFAGAKAAHPANRMTPDTSSIQNNFSLQVTVTLKVAIERTIEWHLLSRS